MKTQLKHLERDTDLPDQAGEHKDADEKVGQLKGNLKDGCGLWEPPDVDQTAHGKVVTAQVPVEEHAPSHITAELQHPQTHLMREALSLKAQIFTLMPTDDHRR